MMPLDPTATWLSRGPMRSFAGHVRAVNGVRVCVVAFYEDGAKVIEGRGASIEEACAQACNRLMALS